jgi:GTPase
MMVAAAWEGAADADVLVLLVDAKAGARALDDIVAAIATRPEPKWLVLNKVDIAAKDKLLTLTLDLHARVAFAETFMISALTGDGVADLKAKLAAVVPQGPWLYPEDQVSDVTTRLLASEITREQLYLQLDAELPYAAAVETEKFEDRKDGSAAIHQQILIERDTQKAIVLGARGTRIKAIGEAARREMETQLERRVHLFLHVKVKPGWAEDRSAWKDLGLNWVD